MRSNYHITELRQLSDQQARFAPRERKLEQLERAEKLFEEIVPERLYTYEYLCFRITGYRPEAGAQETMSGEEARHDLRVFI